MKTAAYLILSAAFMSASLRAQGVSFGEVSFDAESAAIDATWYDPMTPERQIVLEGFGTLEGRTRTITYAPGDVVGGVATIRRTSVEGAANGNTEVIWLAFDTSDDARVLKIVRNGKAVFEASTAATPPLYLPSLPKDGQTWDLAGVTVTVDSVITSNSGTCLKVTYGGAEGQAESRFLRVGDGIIYIEAGSDSGWRPRSPQFTP